VFRSFSMTPPNITSCPSCRSTLVPGDEVCGVCGSAVVAPDAAPVMASLPPVSPSAPTATGYSSDTSPWSVVAERLQSVTGGDYEIFTELGRGGMAAVYLARDLALNRQVAIKVMAPGLLLGAGMVERFKREAVTVANLQHAHIVSIYGVRQIGELH